jgi:hypothetical protein
MQIVHRGACQYVASARCAGRAPGRGRRRLCRIGRCIQQRAQHHAASYAVDGRVVHFADEGDRTRRRSGHRRQSLDIGHLPQRARPLEGPTGDLLHKGAEFLPPAWRGQGRMVQV